MSQLHISICMYCMYARLCTSGVEVGLFVTVALIFHRSDVTNETFLEAILEPVVPAVILNSVVRGSGIIDLGI